MAQLRRIGVLAFTRLLTVMMAMVGLIAGILYSFGGAIIDVLVSLGWITSAETPGVSVGTALAFGALIGMPLLFAGAGLVAGVIAAFLYNRAAGWFGGIEVDFEQ